MPTTVDLAALFSCSQSTIRRWKREGLLAGTPGYEHYVRLDPDDPDSFIRDVFPHPCLSGVPARILSAALGINQ